MTNVKVVQPTDQQTNKPIIQKKGQGKKKNVPALLPGT